MEFHLAFFMYDVLAICLFAIVAYYIYKIFFTVSQDREGIPRDL